MVDEDHKIAEAYGAWREKTAKDGSKKMGIQRSTFIIDANGTVQKTWEAVDVNGHDQEVIEAVKSL